MVEYLWKENRRGKEKVRHSADVKKKKSSRPDFLTGSGAPNQGLCSVFLELGGEVDWECGECL